MSDWRHNEVSAKDTHLRNGEMTFNDGDLSKSWEVELSFTTDTKNPMVFIYDEASDDYEAQSINISIAELRRILEAVEEGIEEFGEMKVVDHLASEERHRAWRRDFEAMRELKRLQYKKEETERTRQAYIEGKDFQGRTV